LFVWYFSIDGEFHHLIDAGKGNCDLLFSTYQFVQHVLGTFITFT
jgi:hypothetical protein